MRRTQEFIGTEEGFVQAFVPFRKFVLLLQTADDIIHDIEPFLWGK